jgi:putative phage-type endonuclease
VNAFDPLAHLADRTEQHPDRASWLAARPRGFRIGASDVPAILGVSPYKTPHDVWASRHRPEAVRDRVDEKAARRGRALESGVLAMYAAETGQHVRHYDNATVRHASVEWAVMSPDGIRADGVPVEAKTTNTDREWPASGPLSWREAPSRDELWSHVVQATWEAVVLEADTAEIAVLLPVFGAGFDLRIYTVATPASLRRWLLDKIAEWRDAHLVGGAEPEQGRPLTLPRGTEARDPNTDLPEATDEEAAAVAAWRACAAARGDAEKAVDAAKDAVMGLARLDKGAGLRVPSLGLDVVWQTSSKAYISPSAVEAADPELFDRLVAAGLVTVSESRWPVTRKIKEPRA